VRDRTFHPSIPCSDSILSVIKLNLIGFSYSGWSFDKFNRKTSLISFGEGNEDLQDVKDKKL